MALNRNPRQGGFTLIEVLVAFFILSVGLLGVAGLMVNSKVSQHQAVQRTRAVQLADSIIERIRINPAAVATYNIGLNPLGQTESPTEPVPNCAAASCTPVELAAHDLWAWEQSLMGQEATDGGAATNGLVAPQACIVFAPAAPRARTGQLSVIIEWHGLTDSTDALQDGDVACGTATAGTDNFRRRIAVNTYVIDETEF